MLRTHTCGELRRKDIGKEVKLCGWIDTIRAHGKISFIDLRDRYGKTQVIIIGKHDLKNEYVVRVSGMVQERKKGTENKELLTGDIEVLTDHLEILNDSEALPFELNKIGVNEEVRLKYRFLDLRNSDIQKNLILRHKLIKSFRDFFDKEGFIEIETPLLGKSTPEGARDYLVPSRIHPGKFYALPQSPQLYKQLLMVGGYDKYFQIARCLRDEDLRADRQPEFTQVDAEMSFADEEDIYDVVERALKFVIKNTLNIDIKIPFQRLTYDKAMKEYKTDKPDLRKNKSDANELSFVWITEFPMFEFNKDEKKIDAAHHPFCMPNDIKNIKKDPLKLKARTYDLVLNGTELLSGSVRIHIPEVQKEIFQVLGLSENEIKEKFGFMLDAFSYGAPPHAGFAIGFDRLAQILLKSPSIREVIAFPKNKDARDIMLNTPSDISQKQLKEAHISILSQKKAKK
ncbi:MAG: aspartate--tRNA ligase [Candidatus Pacearchaeota archaeon]